MKKENKKNIPVTFVEADLDPDVFALRNILEGRKAVEVCEDGTLAVEDNRIPKSKKGDIPNGVLGGIEFPFRNQRDKPKTRQEQETMTGDLSSSEPDHALKQEDKPIEGIKKGDFPNGVLGGSQDTDRSEDNSCLPSLESEQMQDKLDGSGRKNFNISDRVLEADNLRDILVDPTLVVDTPEDISNGTEFEIKPTDRKKGDVPGGVLGTPQWYSRPEMQQQLNFEMKSMEDFVGKPEWGKNCGVLDDGRMYWKVRQRIKADRRNGRGSLYDTTYEILLVYEPDHPRSEHGTSVHAYLKAPNDLNWLQRRVNLSPRTPKNIPHVLTDRSGLKYLCTSGNDFGTSYDDPRGVATAKTSMLAAIKWLHNFECGLLSQEHWNRF